MGPAILVLVGLAHRAVTQGPNVKDIGMAVVGAPLIYAVFLFFSFVPAVAVTTLAAGGLMGAKRVIPGSPLWLWAVAAGCFIYMWLALGRFPDGDGGTMQSMWENVKATCAASVAAWCILATRT